ncbi:MAG: hypothetical protein BWY05_01575 [Euryarchaeota archaeon ADurb.Bin165]|nr:MAG: hypothetical protein BWY05_01575 [Euryarchaeota archaeon ADurb.Bin165]
MTCATSLAIGLSVAGFIIPSRMRASFGRGGMALISVARVLSPVS